MACLEGTAKSAGFIVVSMMPDVCKSPSTPIPYNIVGCLRDSILNSTNVRFQKRWVFDTMSRVATVVGNEAGIGGGVASQTNKGMCKPVVGPSSTVLCNGNQVCRHETTIYEMNILGPEGTSNTLGKVVYLGAMMSGPVGPKGCLPTSANSFVASETPAEVGPLAKIKNSLSINSIEDAVSMSQKAYELAQVDWSDPSAALGALGGMASRAGLGDLAKGLGLANKAMNTDWDDPASALAAAAELAGPLLEAGQFESDQQNSNENPAGTPISKFLPDGTGNDSESNSDVDGEDGITTEPVPQPLPSTKQKEFDEWYQNEKEAGLDWTKDLPDCPKQLDCEYEPNPGKYVDHGKVECDNPDPNVWTEPHDPNRWGDYHPGAEHGIRTNTPAGQPGNQCTYDSNGNRISGGPGAGTADRSSPGGVTDLYQNLYESDGHHAMDVELYEKALELDGGTPAQTLTSIWKFVPRKMGLTTYVGRRHESSNIFTRSKLMVN